MPLSVGDKLCQYQILAPLGAGGMGEVYRAHDTQLERDVAIKVLPLEMANDSERLARFDREAKILAALNHPNIAVIYGLVESDGQRALAMELIPGETLGDRRKRGPMPLDEILLIARQMAEALEAAHERGVVHRDLKPANVMITPTGLVKVLDFGLAAMSQSGTSVPGNPTNSSTFTMGMTQEGVIMGTAAYMAPEQAAGMAVDKRADIWSFGVVLFEMLSGARLFSGDTVAHTLADVLRAPIEFKKVTAPAPIKNLLRRCLDRNVTTRLRDIGEARVAIQTYLANPDAEAVVGQETPSVTSRSRFGWVWPVGVVAILLALLTLSFIHFREQPPDPPKPVRFQLAPENVTIGAKNRFALSPDGTKLAYYATGSDGALRIWIRAMDTLESRSLSATELQTGRPIFWSFDSRFVVFQSAGKLKKIDVSGGPAQTLCDVSGTVVGGSWNREGVIVFGKAISGPLMRVSSEGGAATPITALDPARAEQYHHSPLFLPDGRHFLYYRSGKPESTGIYVGSLDDQPGQPTSKRLLATDYAVEFIPSPDGGSGEILLLREGTLLAQPFDLQRLELAGEPVPVAEQVATYLVVGQFSASRSGALVYRSEAGAKLTWFDRQGKILGTPSDAGYNAASLALSPDGSQAAAVRTEGSGLNIWLADLVRGGRTRFTFTQSAADFHAAWSPDGTRLAFSSSRAGHYDLYQHAANGAGEDEVLFKSDKDKYLTDWSRDGRFLLFHQLNAKNGFDLWVLPMDNAGERKPIPVLGSDFDTRPAHFSPDGRWIAYRSNESGRNEIYVSPFPAPSGGAGKWMVSQAGGNEPRWRRDGKELFYLSPDGQLMASQITASGSAFQASIPKALFKAQQNVEWDVGPDGTKFLFPVSGGDTTQSPFTMVLNWMALLKK